jgi:hypothetical protein
VYTRPADTDGTASRETAGAIGNAADGIPLVTPPEDDDEGATPGCFAADTCTPAAKDAIDTPTTSPASATTPAHPGAARSTGARGGGALVRRGGALTSTNGIVFSSRSSSSSSG